MQVMCLNGWGGKLHGVLLPYLAETRPDVLCLQEVVHTPEAPREWLTYRDGDHILPQRARFFAEVAAALPDHASVFCPAAQGVLWDGQVSVPSQWGLATFVHKSLVIIGQTQGFVHKDFSADGYGAHPRSRSAHAVRLCDPASDRRVTVAHMHGLRDLGGKHDTPARAALARRFADLALRTAQPGDAVVACGDFNVQPGSETLRILRDHGLNDLVTGRGHDGTRTSHYTKPGRFADYMTVSADLAEAPFQVVRDPEGSDHCPLLLTID